MDGRRQPTRAIAVCALLLAACTATGGTATAPAQRPSPTARQPTTAGEPSPEDGSASTDPGPSGAARCPREPGTERLDLEVGDDGYHAQVHVPAAEVEGPLPVVIDLHGLGGNGFAQGAMTGFPRLGDREGFVVVTPTGQRSAGTGLPGWELTSGLVFDEPDRDDVAYVAALVDTLVDRWCVDPHRVYVAGFSNGGYFVSELLCDLADRIAAGASVAGVARPDDCAPARPVPYLAVHGTADPVVPFDGSGDSSLLREGTPEELAAGMRALFSRSMPDELRRFATAAGCAPDPIRTRAAPRVVRHDYHGCRVPNVFVEVEGGGHQWPRALSAEERDAGAFDTTEVVWEFLSQQRLPVGG